MTDKHVIESLLRPAVELNTVAVAVSAAFVSATAPWSLALTPSVGYGVACGFGVLAWVRWNEASVVLRYRRNMRRLPRFEMTSSQIPTSRNALYLGMGFRWDQRHTQRLHSALEPEVRKYVEQPKVWEKARRLEEQLGDSDRLIARSVVRLLSWDHVLNPVRPLPPVGGSPLYHAVEPDERQVLLPLRERVGHTLVLGTTRVGKTRLAELMVTQDIRRGETTIFFDPKGDADMLLRMWAEARRAGREDSFYVFHLGWPGISARYNAVGRFGRISEVASRISGQLSGEGNSAAFREFAWRFINIIARALVALGRRPDYLQISQHVVNIDALFLDYATWYFRDDPEVFKTIADMEGRINEKNTPRHMQGREKRVIALEQFLTMKRIYDPVMDGLKSAVRYDKTYFDKIVASLLPLLEKLTSGKIAQLLAPNYLDLSDPRPIFDWQQIIRKRGIVYVGLDALSDPEIAAAVGNSMFADLVSVAGHIYKFGIDDGLPALPDDAKGARSSAVINLHADEVNELMGDEFVPLINKGGGAGIQVTAYTQTASDITVKMGSTAKAGQVVGNFNNLIMLRVRETATAELLTSQLAKVSVKAKTLTSRSNDNSNPNDDIDFTSATHDAISTTSVPMIEPNAVINQPKGQAFALLEGGQLWKIRMPLPGRDASDKALVPKSIADLAARMRDEYRTGEGWWQASGGMQLNSLPAELQGWLDSHQQEVRASGDHESWDELHLQGLEQSAQQMEVLEPMQGGDH